MLRPWWRRAARYLGAPTIGESEAGLRVENPHDSFVAGGHALASGILRRRWFSVATSVEKVNSCGPGEKDNLFSCSVNAKNVFFQLNHFSPSQAIVSKGSMAWSFFDAAAEQRGRIILGMY